MNSDFHISCTNHGITVLEHLYTPRFIAKCSTGKSAIAHFSGPCWTEKGIDPDGYDDIHIHDQDWIDDLPEQDEFEELMEKAALSYEFHCVVEQM